MVNEESSELLELVRENNKILRSMRRSARIGSFMRYVYWILIIGSAASAYYYLQPYINQLLNVYNELNSTVKNVNSKVNSLPNVSNLKLPADVIQKLDSALKNK
ncbi:MAG: hypothetical protein HY226_05320 [Candidatus Vogelbacteria bacterium]|nr:hypothetical protein [Candidatus Vogelbacteria bacterium]